MNPAKITIQGNYWDCQIYRGRLYLFTINGSIKTINWNLLLESFQVKNFLRVALSYAFKNGRQLYHSDLNELLKDNEIRNVLEEKFNDLSVTELSLTIEELDKYLMSEQDNPFKELHTDSEITSNKLFVLTHNSLSSTNIHRPSKKYRVSRFPEKHFDIYAFALRANNYARIVVSAGNDGLMEYDSSESNLLSFNNDKRMNLISKRHSSFADYSFLSIYNSSLAGDSFLSYYLWFQKSFSDKPERVKISEFDEKEIFKNDLANQSYLSWGSKEKIYRAVEGGLEIVRFNNYAKEGDVIFSEIKFIPFQPWKGRIISASIAYFGTVLQCENAVVVMLSDESFFNISGEISRARIFPRSLNYENHLHVIHESMLEIYSFNNDYFVNQKDKDFGVAFRIPKNFGSFRNIYRDVFEPDEDFYDLNDDKKTNDSDESIINPEDLPF